MSYCGARHRAEIEQIVRKLLKSLAQCNTPRNTGEGYIWDHTQSQDQDPIQDQAHIQADAQIQDYPQDYTREYIQDYSPCEDKNCEGREYRKSGKTTYAFSADTSYPVRWLLPEILCGDGYLLTLAEGIFTVDEEIDRSRTLSEEELKSAKKRILVRNWYMFDSPLLADTIAELAPLKLKVSPIELISLTESVTLKEIRTAAQSLIALECAK